VVLPELLDRIGARKPILVGHSDGASIALIHAGNRTVGGVVLRAPHVFVEEFTLAAIRETRERYRTGDLRERMVRHHDDPDATFSGGVMSGSIRHSVPGRSRARPKASRRPYS
jgi:pimeloyl-ACP methyl ester carboxylesterase